MEKIIELPNFLLQNPIYFGVVFVVMWLLVLLFFSKITGWSRLAEKYRATTKPESKLMQAVQVQWGSIMMAGNIYSIGCTREGMYLGVLFPFRVGHPPLLIPWRDIKTSKVTGLFKPLVRLDFGNSISRPFEIYEKTARRIKECSNGKFHY